MRNAVYSPPEKAEKVAAPAPVEAPIVVAVVEEKPKAAAKKAATKRKG